ncbi:hypothetical protein RRG08_057656 [Elysia crispata]|uniref:Uncharacterized protein n=1 Tax=Elysia crispata TaxID=231223 RepID=A0AAE1A251_9GAST|nr:hypothetical protein RRG08_057656 [Elysia crispata]
MTVCIIVWEKIVDGQTVYRLYHCVRGVSRWPNYQVLITEWKEFVDGQTVYNLHRCVEGCGDCPCFRPGPAVLSWPLDRSSCTAGGDHSPGPAWTVRSIVLPDGRRRPLTCCDKSRWGQLGSARVTT